MHGTFDFIVIFEIIFFFRYLNWPELGVKRFNSMVHAIKINADCMENCCTNEFNTVIQQNNILTFLLCGIIPFLHLAAIIAWSVLNFIVSTLWSTLLSRSASHAIMTLFLVTLMFLSFYSIYDFFHSFVYCWHRRVLNCLVLNLS